LLEKSTQNLNLQQGHKIISPATQGAAGLYLFPWSRATLVA